MLADNSRLAAYVAALQKTISGDSVVVDIGTGPGFFALLACQLGADRVYAIEPDDVIQAAREAAAANGFADRIEFIQDFSTHIALPKKADVIVSDLRGILPWFQHHLPAIIDARSRFLAPKGILLPKRDTLWAAAVEVPETYAKIVGPWEAGKHDLVLSSARNLATNSLTKARVKTSELLGEPVCWYTLEYSEFEDLNMRATVSLSIERPGITHGFALWFDSEVFDGICFSNAPGAEELIYGNMFFPFPEPVAVAMGSRVDIALRADLIGEDYVWRWDTTITDPSSSVSPLRYKQSTLYGTPLSPSKLRKRATTHVPTLSDQGEMDHFILSRIDGDDAFGKNCARLASAIRRSISEF